jgi:hypothetical protein
LEIVPLGAGGGGGAGWGVVGQGDSGVRVGRRAMLAAVASLAAAWRVRKSWAAEDPPIGQLQLESPPWRSTRGGGWC